MRTHGGPRMTHAIVVEDDAGRSDLGAAMLREFDLAVEQVRSGEEAIARLCHRAGDVAVVIASAELAGRMNGIGLARRVSILWPQVNVIITQETSPSSADSATDSDPPGRVVYMPSSSLPLDLVAATERAVRQDHSVHALKL